MLSSPQSVQKAFLTESGRLETTCTDGHRCKTDRVLGSRTSIGLVRRTSKISLYDLDLWKLVTCQPVRKSVLTSHVRWTVKIRC